MNDGKQIQGQIREEDYLTAQRLHLRPRLPFLILGCVLFAVITPLALSKDVGEGLLLFGVFALSLGLAFHSMFYRQPRRTFRQYKAIAEPQTIDVQGRGLYFKRANGEGLVPWQEIVKWRSNESLLLLYPANNVFYLIPRHFFSSGGEFSDFLTLVETKIGKAR